MARDHLAQLGRAVAVDHLLDQRQARRRALSVALGKHETKRNWSQGVPAEKHDLGSVIVPKIRSVDGKGADKARLQDQLLDERHDGGRSQARAVPSAPMRRSVRKSTQIASWTQVSSPKDTFHGVRPRTVSEQRGLDAQAREVLLGAHGMSRSWDIPEAL
jgi:hypothetical protein